MLNLGPMLESGGLLGTYTEESSESPFDLMGSEFQGFGFLGLSQK